MNKEPERLELLVSLQQILSEKFNLEEIQTLCFVLGIDYEDLGGQGKAGKARELVGYVDRRQRIDELIEAGIKLRPDIQWKEILRFEVQTSSNSTSGGKSPGRPVRILFLAANPTNTSPLRLGEEIREIEEALRLAKFHDKFEIQQQWAVRVSDLQEHLLRFKPDIVHFSGHGSETSKIILEDLNGVSKPVSPHAMSNLFGTLKDNIKCVVLNACYSETQGKAIARHIDCVIGMGKEIGDRAALKFAMAFYRALGYGRDIRTAFELGIGEIELHGLDEQKTPKLIARRLKPEEIVFV